MRHIALVGALLLIGAPALAEGESTPTPTPKPKPTPTGKQSLNEVAKEKELNKDAAGEAGAPIVITNENLADYASKGSVTEIHSTTRKTAEGPHAAGVVMVDPAAQQIQERKYYWQQLYAIQMSKIAAIQQQIQQLDADIPGLWNDFYSRDDPAYRDGVIKPRLDESLKRREELEAQLAREQPKLGQIKEGARREGVEPGWLRELKMAPTPPPE
jgi:hypothetical protein